MRPGAFNAGYEQDEPTTHCAQPRQVRVADMDLTTSCLDSPGWWTTTKRMIERGSKRFWARRGMAEPGGRSFGEQAVVDVAAKAAKPEPAPVPAAEAAPAAPAPAAEPTSTPVEVAHV